MSREPTLQEMREFFPGMPDGMLRDWIPTFTVEGARAFGVFSDGFMRQHWKKVAASTAGKAVTDSEPEREQA